MGLGTAAGQTELAQTVHDHAMVLVHLLLERARLIPLWALAVYGLERVLGERLSCSEQQAQLFEQTHRARRS